jgi:hypothetical protein
MKYLIDGEVVDTYGGDFTYMDVWYEIVDGEYIFYKKYYGSWVSDEEVVTDRGEIDEYMRILKSLL